MSALYIMTIAIKIFTAILPIFLFKQYIPSFAQGLFFVFGTFALFGLSLFYKPKRWFSNKWLGCIILWLFISIFTKGDMYIHGEWFNFWMSSAGFIYVLAGALLFLILYRYIEDPKGLLKPILFVCILNFILVVFQIAGHDFLWLYRPTLSGFFSLENQLAQYSAMSLPLIYFINPYLALVPLFTLIASGSLSANLAAIIGMIFLAFFHQIKKSVVLVVALILIIGVVINYGNVTALKSWLFTSRLPAWEKTMNHILKKPYLGYGYQSYNEILKGNSTTIGTGLDGKANPCSDVGHNWFEFGTPLIIFVGLFFRGLWKTFRSQRRDRLTYFLVASIVIALSNMCWQNSIRYASSGGTFIIILALLNIKLNEV